jgi:hypothetical protein
MRRTGSAPNPPAAASAVDSSWFRSLVRRPGALLAVGILAYVAGLVVTLPARLIVQHGEGTNIADVAGSLWAGEAALTSGEVVAWRWAPLRSLAGLGYAADVRLTSDRTALSGTALLRPGSVTLANVAGTAGGALLNALFPRLPFTCDLAMQVAVRRLTIGSGDQHAEGRILGDSGRCAPVSAPSATTPLPPLVLESVADGQLRLAKQGQRRVALADVRLGRDDALSIAVTPAGAAAFPFAVPPGGLNLDTRF